MTAPHVPERRLAAVITVGRELVTGLRVDTNTAEVALALTAAGFDVAETVSIGDDRDTLAGALRRLTSACEMVVTTGGLGPTHDDVTREAAAEALGVELLPDPVIVEGLRERARRHRDPDAIRQVFKQAEVLQGALVLPAAVGTAPGQVVPTPGGLLILLPGPPREMRPMLADALARAGVERVAPLVLSSTGATESDVQVRALRAIDGREGVGFGVLAKPGLVDVVLFDEGAGEDGLAEAADAVTAELKDLCYSRSGEPLAQVVLRMAEQHGSTIGTGESCTGGMIGTALTDIPGSSAVYLGGVVAYSNTLKERMLEVSPAVIAEHGAVSAETAAEMAEGARRLTGATYALSVTGIAGPDGGTAEKPVGLVWFAVAGPGGTTTSQRIFAGDREGVRVQATAAGLDLVRRRLMELA